MKNFIRQPLNLIIFITCLVVVTYFGIKIYKELKPKNMEERKIECLKLGSNTRAAACIKLLK